ncbi:RdgB/HAM1 family non-canonical purine NTP pyrophosphatase [Patescibacteria group bacterium]|nr:RdgB/HAM1 family non-canonical purine NTP pyrophosphatase [Patescibacteria group bacterium]
MNILVATTNPGKVKEYRHFFKDLSVTFLSLKDAGIDQEFEETGQTLAENSLGKASFYGDLSGEMTVADDTGLFVKALSEKPGVKSARYAKTDSLRMKKVLENLQNVPYNEREADFKVVISLYYSKTKFHKSFEGEIKGMIVDEERQVVQRGFGYDPIFYVPKAGKTFAEMTGPEKNALSHRGIAFKKLSHFLSQTLDKK